MYDGSSGSGSNSLLWYSIGESDGRAGAKRKSSREINGLISQINALQTYIQRLERDIKIVVPNRDELHKQAWNLHYELQDAKKSSTHS